MKITNKISFSKLFLGFFFCALSTSFEIHSNLGMGAWSVFHQGLSRHFGISFGQASIISSFFIILIVSFLGLKIGLGTVLNMLFIGWMIDFFNFFNLIADAANTSQGIMMVFLSMLFNALGSCFYIGCGIGCGPRDGLMSALTQKAHLPVGVIRFFIEGSVFLIGWRLGGQVGLGTLINVLCIGIIVNSIYKILNFDIASIHHETIFQTLHSILHGGSTCTYEKL